MADPESTEDRAAAAQTQPPGKQKPDMAVPTVARSSQRPTRGGWLALITVTALAVIAMACALSRDSSHPRTDDAAIFANFIGMAPLVEGPIVELPVRDNQFVHAGDLLFAVDERPYRYALERAISEQDALEGQIEDRKRLINAQLNGLHVASANIRGSQANRNTVASAINEAEADVAEARAALGRAQADQRYAAANLARLEPLLQQQFVTVDQVDLARTTLEARAHAVQQAEAQVALANARLESSRSRFEQSAAALQQSQAQREQVAAGVQTLEPLTKERQERASAVQLARYNLQNCRIYAPFDGYVNNLTLSIGAYVHTGNQVFTLIDNRVWWVVANFRETQLKHITPGADADVFLMSRETSPLHGVVESIGFGVSPDPNVTGVLAPGLPTVQRTLSWVHLASRYPVRIRIQSPPPHSLRIGQSAVAVVGTHVPPQGRGQTP